MKRIALLLTLALFVPTVAGHAAPEPRDFETRILHDHNDDSFVELAGKHGFDAIALDVREVRLPGGAPGMALRLLLNGGCNDNLPDECGTLSHVVKFTTDAEYSVTFATDDGGETWYGDAALYGAPEGINDGTRFAIEGWIAWDAYGMSEGQEVTDWFVEGYWGETEADSMPEGIAPGDDPLGAAFVVDSYAVGTPDAYLDVSGVAEAEPGTVDVIVSNLLGVEQDVMIEVAGPDGIVESASRTETIPVNLSTNVSFEATGGEYIVTAFSNFGGEAFHVVNVIAEEAEAEEATTSPDLASGESWTRTFNEMGTYEYHSHHTGEMASVTVMAAEGEPMEHMVSFDEEGFDPAELMVHMGDSVTWTNNHAEATLMVMGSFDGMPHEEHNHDDHEHGETQDSPGIGLVALLGVLALAFRRR